MIAVPLTIQTASIGIPDTMFLMVLALIVFGPRRLPEIGRQIGKLMYEFRKVSNDFKFQMEEELRASEEASRQQKMQADSAAASNALPPPFQFEAGADTVPVKELGDGTIEANPADGIVPAAHDLDAPPAEAAAVAGEVRGEPRRFPPSQASIQPPSTGETVAADHPFRPRTPESSPDATPQAAASEATVEQLPPTESAPNAATQNEVIAQEANHA